MTIVPAAIENKLAARPALEALVERNVLKGNYSRINSSQDQSIAPALQAQAHDLKMAKLENELSKKLDIRPTVSELVDANIIKGKIAPSLQAASVSLERAMHGDNLAKKIETRPTVSELEQQNILKGKWEDLTKFRPLRCAWNPSCD
jgi:hypothetical protein